MSPLFIVLLWGAIVITLGVKAPWLLVITAMVILLFRMSRQ